MPLLSDQFKGVLGFTEYNIQDLRDTQKNYLIRCHPSCRGGNNSCFQSAVWYDWVVFDLEEDGAISCHILCFLQLTGLKQPYSSVPGFELDSPGTYAIGRRFEQLPSVCAHSQFVKERKLQKQLHLFSTDNIFSKAAVLPDLTSNGDLDLRFFFVVSKRESWLQKFYSMMDRENIKSYGELYGSKTVD